MPIKKRHTTPADFAREHQYAPIDENTALIYPLPRKSNEPLIDYQKRLGLLAVSTCATCRLNPDSLSFTKEGVCSFPAMDDVTIGNQFIEVGFGIIKASEFCIFAANQLFRDKASCRNRELNVKRLPARLRK